MFHNKTVNINSCEINLNSLLINECYCLPSFVDNNIKLKSPNIDIFHCKEYYIDNILTKILSEEQIKHINEHDYSNIRNVYKIQNSIESPSQLIKYIFTNHMLQIDTGTNDVKRYEKELKNCFDDDKKMSLYKMINKNKSIIDSSTIVVNKLKTLCKTFKLCSGCFLYNMCNSILDDCENIICVDCIDNYEKNKMIIPVEKITPKKVIINKLTGKIVEDEESDTDNMKIKCLRCDEFHFIKRSSLNKILEEPEPYIKKIVDDELIYMDKTKVIEKIINVCDKKIIVFLQFRSIINHINNICHKFNYTVQILDGGNVKDLDNILNNFKTNKKKQVLIIDDCSLGVGINMEYTTDIIFLSKIDEKSEKQLIGRAQRFGRTTKLNIWKLFYKNEN